MTSTADTAEELFYEGTRLMGTGDAAGAERALRAALQLAPDLAEAHVNLGLLLERTGRPAGAERHYLSGLALDPALEQAHLNYGALLTAQKRFAEAEACYRQALRLDAAAPGAWSSLGVLLACMQREREAEHCYRRAIALDPDYRKASFNLAYVLLRQGRYEEGWRRLEARDWYAGLERHLHFPRWQGEALCGKTLLIGFEAGHGDMIQFCRYAGELKRQGAAWIAILCHPGLTTLLAGMAGVDQTIAFDAPLPERGWDYWTLPLSLPFLLHTRLDTIPAALPYLAAAPARVAHWAGVIGAGTAPLRVGLAWQGNPRFENDAERSLPSVDLLAPLAAVAGVRFFSLQKGAGAEQTAQAPAALALTDLGSASADFADTAAMIMNLDLVIAVDTAVAHLAGALGKPCWVLLPDYKTDWRWLTARSDTPWYPGVMRLFRQPAGGGWDAVLGEVAAALLALATQTKLF